MLVTSLEQKSALRRIAANGNLYDDPTLAQQLFAVARKYFKDIVTEEQFCPLAREIVHFAAVEDLATLEACDADKNRYPVLLIATLFKNLGKKLTGIDYETFRWDHFDFDAIDHGTRQRLWLALVAVLHESLDDKNNEEGRLALFCDYITRHHGIDFKASTPLTELDTQIIRLLPVAIEYILSRDDAEAFMKYYIENTTALYKALHSRIAGNQALSLYFHSCFFLNPAVDLKSKLSHLQSPPINDIQMTKEIFEFGDNLDRISDTEERRLATAARQQLETLLFPKQQILLPPEQHDLPPEQQDLPPPEEQDLPPPEQQDLPPPEEPDPSHLPTELYNLMLEYVP